MPYPKLKSENYTNFGGLNLKASHYVTDKNEFLKLENVSFQTIGALSKIWGNTQASNESSFSPITSLFQYNIQSFTNILKPLAVDSTVLYEFSGLTLNPVFLPLRSASYAMDFVGGTQAFCANGIDWLWYAGSTQAYRYCMPKPNDPLASVTVAGPGGLTGYMEAWVSPVRFDGFYGPAASGTYALTGSSYIKFTADMPLGYSLSEYGYSGMAVYVRIGGASILSYGQLVAGPGITLPEGFAGWTTYTQISGRVNPENLDFLGAGNALSNPVALEIYSNQLFNAGNVSYPDRVQYSRIGEYEKNDAEAFFEVGSGDGDLVVNLVSYFTQLIIFKRQSIYALSGADPDTFQVATVTTQYGCLSNRSACVWEQNLWFLDTKGIAEYNGANTKIVSDGLDPIFARMNVAAARSSAFMLHVKSRKEIWCAFPVDGSTTNNIIVVFDYVSKQWYTKTNEYLASAYETSIGTGDTRPILLSGNYQGQIKQYGPSLFLDNPNAFTCAIKSRYLNDLGNSVEKMFRRLYVDADIPTGSTQDVLVNFYTNQSDTPALQITMSLSEFQKRIDFGLSAKDLSVEFVYSGAEFFKLNGYTIEYRFQRAV